MKKIILFVVLVFLTSTYSQLDFSNTQMNNRLHWVDTLFQNFSSTEVLTILNNSSVVYDSDTSIFTLNELDIKLSMLWALAQPIDTIATITPFTDVTDITVSTLTESDVVGIGINNVVRVSTNLGEYKVLSKDIWTEWNSAMGFFADVDSARGRHTSSSSNNVTTNQTLYIGGVSDIFSITTVAGGGDTLDIDILPNGNAEASFAGDGSWVSAFGATVTQSTGEQVYAGTYSAKTVTVGIGEGARNIIEVVQDSAYWVEGYYYLSSGGANVYANCDGAGVVLSTTDAWTYFKYKFTATSTAIKSIYFTTLAATATTFYLDNVTVRKLL